MLISYSINELERKALKNDEYIDLSKKAEIILLEGSFPTIKNWNKSADTCYNIDVATVVETCWDPSEKHTYEDIQAGADCKDPTPPSPPVHYISFTPDNCDSESSGGGEQPGPSPLNPGGGPGGVSEPVITDPDKGDLTTPLLPTDEYLLERFFTSLSDDQKSWIFDGNLSWFNSKIVPFLMENDVSLESKLFAREGLNTKIAGGEVYFEEAYIPVDTPDDNYVYQGSKKLIPNPLILPNDTQISITFGTTNNNINANQPVAIDLIMGLKFALQEANSNLSASNQITSIYISATTNGHGTTGPSNHLKATAVDISRLNGNKMALTGVTPQIIELQKAMDNYEYIRENFGPYFKHKYSIESDSWNYNHPVSGHKDHIHFSIKR